MLKSGRKPSFQNNNNDKKWSQAMERYNLPTGGIEVVISGGQPIKTQMVDKGKNPRKNSSKPPVAITPQAKPALKAPQAKRIRPLRYIAVRSLVLVGAFAIIGNIPVHSKITTTEASHVHFAEDELTEHTQEQLLAEQDNTHTQSLNLPVAIKTYSGQSLEVLPSTYEGDWALHQIARGETLEDIIASLGVTTDSADILTNTTIKQELSKIKPGKKLLFQIKGRQVEQLIYATGKRKAYIVSRQKDRYVGKWNNSGLFEEQHNRIAFTIRNPLHYEAKKAGLPNPIARQLTKIFKKDINFRKIQIGDQVSTIFEDYYYQSDRIFTGKILAAEFKHRDDIYQRVRFAINNDKPMYLRPDSDLELKEVAFARRPLKRGRQSSGFGMRLHPILRKRRMHSGTDFAAPRGTPIYATGSGVVRFVGRKGGYGKSIELRHAGGIMTRYGHMSKYMKDLSVGDKVKRGDVIGYVGSTGRSSGNHVHYEFRVNGKPENPMTVKLPTKGILTAKEMKDFKRVAKNMSYQLIKLRETASIERNVRQQFGG